jgi:hypothetical protein
MSFRDELEREIIDLERRLSELQDFQRLQAARKLLAYYESQTQDTTIDIPQEPSPSAPVGLLPASDDGVEEDRFLPEQEWQKLPTLTKQLVALTHEYIGNRVHPIPTRELYVYFLAQGISFQGAHPKNYIGSVLSKCKEFKSNGHSGWTRVKPRR